MYRHRWALVILALIGMIGVIAGAVFAAGHGDTEVRISAIRHDDGRVEVGLQQRGAEGQWGERILPEYRFLRPTSSGIWLTSSPISIVAGAAHDEDAMGDPVAMPEADSQELYCIIHHGSESDPFWIAFNGFARSGAAGLGLTNVDVMGEPMVTDQAAAIMDCIDREAVAIASTIPDLEGLSDALVAARASGAVLITFNSGAEVAGRVGSTVHYGLDDQAAGRLAGVEFNNAGVTGNVLCISHEPVNIGLSDRCTGLDETYDGDVVRVTLEAGALSNPVAAGTEIAAAIGSNEAAGVLVLNGALTQVATQTVAQLESEAMVGVIGGSPAAPFLVDNGQLLFAIDDGSQVQATHVVLAIKNVDANPAARTLLALSASQSAGTTNLLMRPLVLNQDYISNLPADWKAQSCALIEQIAPMQAAALCGE